VQYYSSKERWQHTLILDREFGYSPEFAYTRLSQLSEVGRLLYAQTQLTLDMAFPAIYATFIASTMSFLIKPMQTKWPWLNYLAGLPFLGALADVTENVSIVLLITYFPVRLDFVARLASLAGVVKHILVFGSVGLIVVLVLMWVFSVIQNRASRHISR
jgi:hypothetical protein